MKNRQSKITPFILRKGYLSVLASLFFALGTQVKAQDTATSESAKNEPSWVFNASVVSDYRYRGISQTRLQPALQGGVDYTHPSGWYVGAWASTIKWIKDSGGKSGAEIDGYAGKRGSITEKISYDMGALSYVYPSNQLTTNANTTEIYGQLSYGPAYLKYSHAITPLFGFPDSKQSHYLDVGANIELGDGLTLNLQAGRQQVKNNSLANYSNWKLGMTQDFHHFNASLSVQGTNASRIVYTSASNQAFLGKTAWVASISKSF